MDYPGHVVYGNGVEMDKNKIEAILQWPPPNTIKQFRGFLGLIGYYRWFIRDYASLHTY